MAGETIRSRPIDGTDDDEDDDEESLLACVVLPRSCPALGNPPDTAERKRREIEERWRSTTAS
jgi:hypothetical protein